MAEPEPEFGKSTSSTASQNYASTSKIGSGGNANKRLAKNEMDLADMTNNDDPHTIGADFDFLASTRPIRSPISETIAARKKCAVIVSMRNEGLSILEWVAHYRALKFDSLFIYTNGNDDGSDELLLALHRARIITLAWNPTPQELSAQIKAYRHAFWFSEAVAEHEWITFIDADEFIIPLIDKEMTPIDLWLSHLSETYNCSSISLNWRWFPGQMEFEMSDGLLAERYRDAVCSDHVKSIFKLRSAVDITIHFAAMKKGEKVIDDGGRTLEKASSLVATPTGKLGQVNHYWNKSFQEFYIKRQRGRGAADRKPRDWTSFFTFGRGKVSPDPYPPKSHIDNIHSEISFLRSISDVADAENKVRRNMAALLSSKEVLDAYEETRRSWSEPQ